MKKTSFPPPGLLFFLISFCTFFHAHAAAAKADETWKLAPFTKQDDANPVLLPRTDTEFLCPILGRKVKWEEKDVFNPAAVVKDGKVYLLYRAEDRIGRFAGTSRIGLAWSEDGLHFTSLPEPVLYPDNDDMKQYEWEGGCEDPRVVEDENGTYFMTYTAYDGKLARLSVASSKDLFHWKKHGLAFAKAENGKYNDVWSKSGSIVTEVKDGRIIAKKINGKYWMYYGESDIFIATSENLIDWTPVEGNKSRITRFSFHQPLATEKLERLMTVRNGNFDSALVEPGPPALLTGEGIVFIYNSKNANNPNLPLDTYAAGQVLVDPADPAKALSRTESYFFAPDKPYEITGQVNNVVFLEGLAFFKNNFFLYYGTADSKIAVAVLNDWKTNESAR